VPKDKASGCGYFSSLALKELKGNCDKVQALRIGTDDLVELGLRLKKESRT
jgi:hypothetical protein